jgi:hypothetical protein
MAYRHLVVALSLTVAVSPALATQSEPPRDSVAPPAPADARYCLWVEPQTGSRLESVECWTREEWAEADVDVDQEWAENGVRVLA